MKNKKANDYQKEYNNILDHLLRFKNELNIRMNDLKRLNPNIAINEEIFKKYLNDDNISNKISIIKYYEDELEKTNLFKQMKMFGD